MLFDSCWDPFPQIGPQRAPKPGVHNSGWLQSPGANSLKDPNDYDRLRQYVQGGEGKQEADANRIIQEFSAEGIQVLNGRYGPYVTDGKKNAKIPKDRDPKSLTLEECRTLIEQAPVRTGGRFGRGKRAARAVAPEAPPSATPSDPAAPASHPPAPAKRSTSKAAVREGRKARGAAAVKPLGRKLPSRKPQTAPKGVARRVRGVK